MSLRDGSTVEVRQTGGARKKGSRGMGKGAAAWVMVVLTAEVMGVIIG